MKLASYGHSVMSLEAQHGSLEIHNNEDDQQLTSERLWQYKASRRTDIASSIIKRCDNQIKTASNSAPWPVLLVVGLNVPDIFSL
jgi:hypothetical protein